MKKVLLLFSIAAFASLDRLFPPVKSDLPFALNNSLLRVFTGTELENSFEKFLNVSNPLSLVARDDASAKTNASKSDAFTAYLVSAFEPVRDKLLSTE